MPDWSYHTTFKPVLRRLGPRTGRNVALRSLGLLAGLPLGRRIIQLMGHMSPDPRLTLEKRGMRFASRVGLGCRLDPFQLATAAIAEFGVGYLEIGPIREPSSAAIGSCELDPANETLLLHEPYDSLAATAAAQRLRDCGGLPPVLARIEPADVGQAGRMLRALSSQVDGLIAPLPNLDSVLKAAAESPMAPAVLAAVGVGDLPLSDELTAAVNSGEVLGLVLVPTADENGVLRLGNTDGDDAVGSISELRASAGPDAVVISAMSIHAPADALDALEAGADLVQIDTGLIFAGPGLAKRINEALLYRRLAKEASAKLAPPRAATLSWFWAFLMGLSMFLGGLLAMLIAATRIVLPYDESMAGLTRAEMSAINPRLLPFMQHDRVTLAGTMLAIGVLYMALSWYGIRRGVHWAYVAVVASALAGFFSFFSFLGFGYFDPFHAFVTAILFQFLLLTMHATLPLRSELEPPGLWNDRAWQRNQWGQLLFVVQGAALLVAGMTISWIGMTTVFVQEDLEFMQTTAAELAAAHPRLIPLVAHDRATFGGMLISCGLATLLPAIWGFQRGQAWLWWALMIAGTIGYAATMQVHWVVGYHDVKHLGPAIGGLILLWAGGLASFQYLVLPDAPLQQAWEKFLAPANAARGEKYKKTRNPG